MVAVDSRREQQQPARVLLPSRPHFEGADDREMVNPKRLEAARGRRDRHEDPQPLDNLWLLLEGEDLNARPERSPIEPDPGSHEARILHLLRERSRTVPELAHTSGIEERPVREAIDRLRSRWFQAIVNDDHRFVLLGSARARRSA